MTFNFWGETKFEVFAQFCTNVSNSKAVCLIEDFFPVSNVLQHTFPQTQHI